MSHTTADADAASLVLIDSISSKLEEQLLQYDAIEGKADFVLKSHLLPDSYTEFYITLSKHPLREHSWLWLLSVKYMCAVSLRILLLEQKLKQSKLRAIDPPFLNASASYAQSFTQLLRFLDQIYREVDLSFVLSCRVAKKAFLDLMAVSVEICLIDPVCIYTTDSLVDSMAVAIQRYSRSASADSDAELFSILVSFGKLAYLSGNCALSLPLIIPELGRPLVTEKLVPHLVENSRVSLEELVDFYRYYAYSLVTIVVECNKINDLWLDKADMFLRVLLNLPSLQLSNYVSDLGSSMERFANPARYVSALERGELSFFFMLSYLLRLRSLADLVDPEKHFVAERLFFLTTFNKRVATELDISASSSSSRAGSVVSMTKYTEPYNAPPPHTTNRTLSSILSQGSYKEKVRLVLEFFNLIGDEMASGSIRQVVKLFDFAAVNLSSPSQMNPGDSEILHLLNRLDKHVYPGKALYVTAIDKIVRLLQLLAIDEFSNIFGPSTQPAQILHDYLQSHYSVEEILSCKDILVPEDGGFQRILGARDSSMEDFIQKQFETLELTQELEKSTQTFY